MDEQAYLEGQIIYMKSIIKNSGEIINSIIGSWFVQKDLNSAFDGKISQLKKALQFYANPDNYKDYKEGSPEIEMPEVLLDFGQRARDILKERL